MYLVPMTRCFQNPVILQKIFEAAGRDPVKRLEWRLVSKRFDREYLRWIRKTHRKIRVVFSYYDFGKEFDMEKLCEFQYLKINNHHHKNSTTKRYLEFLVQVARVKVTNFTMKHACEIKKNEEFHNDVLNVLLKDQKVEALIGLEDSCREGCEDCKRHVLSCDVYGPVQFDFLKSLWKDRKQHFKMLIIDDLLLHRVATHCSELSESREQCLNVMKTLITSNITCDRLQLNLPDDLSNTGINYHGEPIRPLPREVIEEICRKWNVKSITLQFTLFSNYQRLRLTDWTEKENFFTMYNFDCSYQSSQVSTGISLKEVEINMEEADFLCSSVFVVDCRDSQITCDNLIANAGKMFPTKRMHIKTYRYRDREERSCRKTGVINEKNFEKIIKAFFLNHLQRNMEYTLDFQHRIVTNREHFDFPERYMYHHQEVNCSISEPFKEMYHVAPTFIDVERVLENIGVTFRFRNIATNCVLNLNVYVEKRKLKELMNKESVKEDEFLKYYTALL